MLCLVGNLYGSVSSSVSMMIDDSGNRNLLTRRYFMHLASLRHPLSSWREKRYEIPQITARFRPCADGGGPPGAPCGDGGGAKPWEDAGACDGTTERGSATCVTAWQSAQRMDLAPGGSCRGVRQWEQLMSINMIESPVLGFDGDGEARGIAGVGERLL